MTRPPAPPPPSDGDGGREGEPAPEVRWGLGDAAVGYVVGFFMSALFAAAWAQATGGHPVGSTTEDLGTTAAGLLGLWVGLAGAPVWASLSKGSGSLRRDYGLWVRARDIPLGMAVGLGCQIILVPVLYLPFRLVNPHIDQQLGRPAQHLTGLAHGSGVALLVVLLTVGAPVVEELFFRGLLLRSLGRRFGAAAAVIGSGVLFGLIHFEPLQLLALVVFGVVLGYLAVRTGRLGPGIFAHAAFNAVTVAVLVTGR